MMRDAPSDAAARPTAEGEPLVLLAAGGTGGHVFPAAALASELLARGRAVALATDGRGASFEKLLGDKRDRIAIFELPAASPAGGLIKKLRAAIVLARAMLAARRLIRRQRPSVTVGFGGHPSVPPVLAATGRRLPTMIHEQNALLGRANRMLAGRVDKIATSFPKVRHLDPTLTDRVTLVGNPVRPDVALLSREPYAAPAPNGKIRLLVIGGSQGARVFSSVMPGAVALLPEGLRKRLIIWQQCRQEDLEEAETAYAKTGAKVDLSPFFGDVPRRLNQAHLVVCRSGASTVAELTAAGRPAILVPYPYASDDHQMDNARALASGGAGWLMPEHGPEACFTAEDVATRLKGLFRDTAKLTEAAEAGRALGRPEAAGALADLVETLLPPAR